MYIFGSYFIFIYLYIHLHTYTDAWSKCRHALVAPGESNQTNRVDYEQIMNFELRVLLSPRGPRELLVMPIGMLPVAHCGHLGASTIRTSAILAARAACYAHRPSWPPRLRAMRIGDPRLSNLGRPGCVLRASAICASAILAAQAACCAHW